MCSCPDDWCGYGDDCDDCAYESGKEDALSGEEYDNPYKNWSQSNAYYDGYYNGCR
jgi:hypothetical protein